MKQEEVFKAINEFSNTLGKLQEAAYFVFADPLEDEEIEKLRLQYTKTFYRMLGQYANGKMSKVMIINHIKEYLESLEKILENDFLEG
ncbi:MAG: hypothetical protein J7K61_02035 [Thermoplasmata archaeon]|nr:hypothetical protein [Thermoplasmata archaeon]